MNDTFIRRRDAAQYLLGKYGFGAERTLAKGAVTGDTPEYQGRAYRSLYAWSLGPLGTFKNMRAAHFE
jgi:hypothetical protein